MPSAEEQPQDWVREPSGTHTHTIIYLHDFSCSGRSYVEDTPQFFAHASGAPFPGLRVVCPDAPLLPITCHGGRPDHAWYDTLTDHGGAAEDDCDADTLRSAARDRVHGLVRAETDRLAAVPSSDYEDYGPVAPRVFLGGCAQGVGAALWALASLP
eukprot:CAMPEP_0194274444 /NCGR_PEP_ID=MMETSP0169-20130528/7530_1 /TAXON_ID=218684 /ORGANISM="Corethron pennatum, Strain L29A3" /LENGTH=155 /DNA_ID=CAMNT_0039017645 /DNA_START=120 /DNA_END=584 /DNA_ORIENTATION=-